MTRGCAADPAEAHLTRERRHTHFIRRGHRAPRPACPVLTSPHSLVSRSPAGSSPRCPAPAERPGGNRVGRQLSIHWPHRAQRCSDSPPAGTIVSELTCPGCPGAPAPLLEISSVREETYLLCSSRIISSCRLSCLISR